MSEVVMIGQGTGGGGTDGFWMIGGGGRSCSCSNGGGELSLVTGDLGGGGGLPREADDGETSFTAGGGETGLTGWNQAGGDWCLGCRGWSELCLVSLLLSLTSLLTRGGDRGRL